MKIVLDTNVLVSGIFWNSGCAVTCKFVPLLLIKKEKLRKFPVIRMMINSFTAPLRRMHLILLVVIMICLS